MSDERMMEIISTLMTKLKKNQALQEVAKENDVTLEMSVDYSDSNVDNIITSTVALTLAKYDDDPDYMLLTHKGIKKKSLMNSIISKYKDKASMYLDKYKASYS